MQQSFNNFKEFFRSIQILHGALFTGMVMMMIVLKFVVGIEERNREEEFLVTTVGVVLAMSALILGHFLFTKKIDELKKDVKETKERLVAYRAVYILKLALLEGAALFCLLLHFLNGTPILFYTFIFLLVMFALNRPIADQIVQTLQLSQDDRQ